jgi:hypothetical protein
VSDSEFSELGLRPDASAAQVKDARRRLAQEHHPDLGGDDVRMKAINEAAAIALRSLEARASSSSNEFRSDPSASKLIADWDGHVRDVASFTVEALPAQAFEGLVVAAARMGELIDDDPPYRLEARLSEPIRCWCQLDVLPDAGASTVSLTVGPTGGQAAIVRLPNVEQVRDAWVDTLNEIDWT